MIMIMIFSKPTRAPDIERPPEETT